MFGRSADSASSKVIHLRSTNSWSGPTASGSSAPTASRKARKKRVSKRRGRLGGVMARNTKVSAERSGMTPASTKRCHSDAGGRAFSSARRARRGPVFSAVSRVPAARGARPAQARTRPLRRGGIEGAERRHLAVGGIDAASGEHELAGNERVAGVAQAQQHARRPRVAVDEHEGGSVARTHRRPFDVAVLMGGGVH